MRSIVYISSHSFTFVDIVILAIPFRRSPSTVAWVPARIQQKASHFSRVRQNRHHRHGHLGSQQLIDEVLNLSLVQGIERFQRL